MELRTVAEAANLSDPLHSERRGVEHVFGPFDPKLSHVSLECHPLALNENFGEVAGGKPRDPRHLRHAEGLAAMIPDQLDGPADTSILAGFVGLRHGPFDGTDH